MLPKPAEWKLEIFVVNFFVSCKNQRKTDISVQTSYTVNLLNFFILSSKVRLLYVFFLSFFLCAFHLSLFMKSVLVNHRNTYAFLLKINNTTAAILHTEMAAHLCKYAHSILSFIQISFNQLKIFLKPKFIKKQYVNVRNHLKLWLCIFFEV